MKESRAIHLAMLALGVTEALLVIGDDLYEYIYLGDQEYQFGVQGDCPTNYILD